MAKVTGKLKKDIRINGEGKEDGAGRLYLAGEFVAVDESLADRVDTRAKRAPRSRFPSPFADKQYGPDRVKALEKENAELRAKLAGK